MSESTTAKANAKPPVKDQKDTVIELGMRVKLCADRDKDAEGKPRVGTVTGLEYQRARAVIKVDGQEKLAVRPASTLWIVKNKSGKIERVERAVRAGKAEKAAPAKATPAAKSEAGAQG